MSRAGMVLLDLAMYGFVFWGALSVLFSGLGGSFTFTPVIPPPILKLRTRGAVGSLDGLGLCNMVIHGCILIGLLLVLVAIPFPDSEAQGISPLSARHCAARYTTLLDPL